MIDGFTVATIISGIIAMIQSVAEFRVARDSRQTVIRIMAALSFAAGIVALPLYLYILISDQETFFVRQIPRILTPIWLSLSCVRAWYHATNLKEFSRK